MTNPSPKVLIVEDETLLLNAIAKKLSLSGFETISCTSGQQAVDYLNNLEELPNAIWLDYYLKDMNGLEFMENIRGNAKWTHIPVIVVSNSASPEKVNRMLALGVSKYVLKAGYRLEEIIKLLHEFISTEQSNS